MKDITPNSNTNNCSEEQMSMSGDFTTKDLDDSKKHIPTPEEFLDIFCPANLKIMKFTGQMLNNMQKHGQIFLMANNDSEIEPLNDDDIETSTETSFEKISTTQLTDYKFNTTKSCTVFSKSIAPEECESQIESIPIKRKATADISIDLYNKCSKLINIELQYNLKYSNSNYESKMILENVQNIPSINIVSVASNLIYDNPLYRCFYNEKQIENQILIKINSYETIHNNLQTRQNYLNDINDVEPLSINELYNTKNIITFKRIINRCLNNNNPIWDTQYLIRKLKSFYNQITNNFINISGNFDYLLITFAITLLSNTSLIKGRIPKKILYTSYVKFQQNRTHFTTNTTLSLFKQFGDSIIKLINRNFNINKYKLIRLISFILYSIENNIQLPNNTLKISSWSIALNWFCKFDSCFIRMYRNIELVNMNNRKRKIKRRVIVTSNQLYKLLHELFYGPNVRNEKLETSIYECICGKIFNSYHDWNEHTTKLDIKTQIVLQKLHEVANISQSNPKSNTHCVIKHNILSINVKT